MRLIAATNRDLAKPTSREGRFREDLYYRLNVVHIEMPPLRLRGSDVLVLANHFLARFAAENHKRMDGFTDQARAQDPRATAGRATCASSRTPSSARSCSARATRDRREAPPVRERRRRRGAAADPRRDDGGDRATRDPRRTLEATGGSTSKAAEILDISVRTIQYRLHEYGVR